MGNIGWLIAENVALLAASVFLCWLWNTPWPMLLYCLFCNCGFARRRSAADAGREESP